MPHRLGEPPDLVDRLRPLRDQDVAGVVEPQHLLVDFVAQEHRVQHCGVGYRQPRQLPRVVAVVLRVGLGDRRYLAGIANDRLEPHLAEQPVHPAAVRSGLERDGPGTVELREHLLESGLCRSAGRLQDDASLAALGLGHHADFRRAVAHVGPDCGTILHVSPSLGFVVLVFAPPTAEECAFKSIIAESGRGWPCHWRKDL